MKWIAALAAATLVTTPVGADAPGNPNPFDVTVKSSAEKTRGQKVTRKQCLKGEAKSIRITDCEGHTLIEDPDSGETVYAMQGADGNLEPVRGCGEDDPDCDPTKMGIPLDVKPSPEMVAANCGTACHFNSDPPVNKIILKRKEEKKRMRQAKALKKAQGIMADGDEDEDDEQGRRMAANFGDHNGGSLKEVVEMQNLVLLIQFNDHESRCLPTETEISELFNTENALEKKSKHAPSGSVKDCFLKNSYGQFSLKSHICDWCLVPEDEKYYGDGNYGMTGKLNEAIAFCLEKCQHKYDFVDFDVDEDKNMDAIAIISSGYGSEWGGGDFVNRIWSHKWEMANAWQGKAGIRVHSYHISPALWGVDGCNIGRIGVICHETGHFFGLPDLYDGSGGNGVGTTCLMGNSWGFDGSQWYPPMMSAWAKLRLGWADPEVITQSGTYTLPAAHRSSKVFVFINPANPKEYFLLENKQKDKYFEEKLPQEGLNIYHIDDNSAFDAECYPGEPDWPEEHYRIAVVQPDGAYHLEKGMNLGDAGDVFHGAFRDFWGPNGVGKGPKTHHAQPTTDWYSSGKFVSSGISVNSISPSGPEMIFQVVMDGNGGGQEKDYDWGGDGRDSNTCKGTNEECTNHMDCCSPPKRRCRYVKKAKKNMCKVKNSRKKKVSGVELRQRMLRRVQ